MGKYEKGVEVAKKAIQLDPDSPVGYLQLAFHQQYEGHLKEAEDALRRAAERKLEMPELLFQRYDLAFLNNDTAEMERTVALGKRKIRRGRLAGSPRGFCSGIFRSPATGQEEVAARGGTFTAIGPTGKDGPCL